MWTNGWCMMTEQVRQILGLRRVGSRLDLAGDIEKGLPVGAIHRVKEALALADTQVSSALGVSPKTLSRLRKQRRRLPATVGDRLYRLANIFALARDVMESAELAREWLRTPQIGLDGQRPLELMRTEAGAREVEDLLSRIEYGVLS
jgi:putative toxin-antitoxin system antitoxin component (TIGR02293 family)